VDSVSVGDWTLNAKAESAVSYSLSAGFHIVPAGDPNADAIVIISPRVGPALGAGPMQVPMTAIGVLHVNSPFGRFKAVVHAMYTLSVVDAKTGAVLTSASGKLPNTDFFGEHADPIEELPASVWPDNPKMLANGQRAAIKESVERLLAGSLRYTSQTLLLTTTN
jgi:hypothetical protein